MTRRWLIALKVLPIAFAVIAIAIGDMTLFAASGGKQLVYGYVTPGPDTWYKRDVDGFV